jgi:hypothetical protein
VEGFTVTTHRKHRFYAAILLFALSEAAISPAQTPAQTEAQPQPAPAGTYQPKFAGDPARSESESEALGYMRVVLRAQRLYKRRHAVYADSLLSLAGTGSFTKRMAHSTNRGDYTVSFHPRKVRDDKDKEGKNKDGFVLTVTPKQLDPQHRSFYADEDGAIHADDQKPADLDSPTVR